MVIPPAVITGREPFRCAAWRTRECIRALPMPESRLLRWTSRIIAPAVVRTPVIVNMPIGIKIIMEPHIRLRPGQIDGCRTAPEYGAGRRRRRTVAPAVTWVITIICLEFGIIIILIRIRTGLLNNPAAPVAARPIAITAGESHGSNANQQRRNNPIDLFSPHYNPSFRLYALMLHYTAMPTLNLHALTSMMKFR